MKTALTAFWWIAFYVVLGLMVIFLVVRFAD